MAEPNQQPSHVELDSIPRAEYEEGILNGMGHPPATANRGLPGPSGK